MTAVKMQSMVFDAVGKVRVGEVDRPVLLEPIIPLTHHTGPKKHIYPAWEPIQFEGWKSYDAPSPA